MKKNLFMMAAATAMLFTACTNSDDVALNDRVINENAPQPVEFGTYLGKTDVTRTVTNVNYTSGPIGNADDATNNVTALAKTRFGVFSYYTANNDYAPASVTTTPSNIAPNFMYNQELQYDDAKYWIYSPVKYWPNGIDLDNTTANPSNTATQAAAGKLSFFAVAPFTATPTTAYDATNDGALPTDIANADYVKKNAATNGISAMTTNAFTGNVWVKYLMPTATEAAAVDLLWGLAGKASYDETDTEDPSLTIGDSYNLNLTKQKVNGEKVKFLFKHALTKIGGTTANGTESLTGDPASCGFKVVADIDANETTSPTTQGANSQTTYFADDFNVTKTLITLKEVKIQDGASAATDGHATNSTTSKIYTSGWFNIETGTWAGQALGTGATYNVTANSTNEDLTDNIYTINNDIKEPADATAVAAILDKSGTSYVWNGDNTSGKPRGVDTGTNLKNVFTNENVPGLLLIPGSSAEIYITVTYVVRTADKNLALGYSEVKQTITNKVSLASLDSNKYYTIIMHLGLTSVKFEAKVADWATAAGGTYDTNGNYTTGGTANETSIWLPSNVE